MNFTHNFLRQSEYNLFWMWRWWEVRSLTQLTCVLDGPSRQAVSAFFPVVSHSSFLHLSSQRWREPETTDLCVSEHTNNSTVYENFSLGMAKTSVYRHGCESDTGRLLCQGGRNSHRFLPHLQKGRDFNKTPAFSFCV